MSEEKLAVEQILLWQDRSFLMVVGMFVLGSLGRSLCSSEPFSLRKFLGEIILSVLGAIALYFFEIMQGMSPAQIVFFGAMGSLGGYRMIDWTIKLAKHVKSQGS